AVVAAGVSGWLWWQGHTGDEAVRQRDDRALRLVTASDITNIRATAQPGAPPDAHATYRGRAGTTTAVVTLSHMAPLPAGRVYQVWARHGDAWVSLGVAHVDASGSAMLIVEGGRVLALPDGLEVTIEHGHGSAQPEGTVVAAWSAP